MTRNRKKPKYKDRGRGNVKKHKPSYTILAIAGFMAIFGLTMIYSGSIYTALQQGQNQYYFLILQAGTIVISIIPAVLIYLWDYRKIAKLSLPALIIMIVLLIGVLFTPEQAANGAARWFNLGIIKIQPSEFIKPIIVVYLASWLAKQKEGGNTGEAAKKEFYSKLAGFGAILVSILVLIMFQPDLGTTILIAMTAFIMFFLSGSNLVHTIGTAVVGVSMGLVGLLAGILAPYRFERITTFTKTFFTGEIFDPQNAGYQIQQILIGLSSGGFLGKGLFKSTQAKGFLVERTAYTDSTIAVMQEELGFVSLAFFIILWLTILWKGIQISLKAPDKQGQLMAAGLTIYLTLQALLNMGANNITIPLTGIPLPFLTYGGSSILVTMSSFALLLNISRYTND